MIIFDYNLNKLKMKENDTLKSRNEKLQKLLADLDIIEDDTDIMYDLRKRIDEGYVRNNFESVPIEIALKKSSGVHDKGEVISTNEMVIVRYRSSIKDDGIAIWKRNNNLYAYYRWYDDLD